MVSVVRTWNWDENFTPTQGSGFDTQAQEIALRIHELINGDNGVDSAGNPASGGAWTVENSSPGDGTVGAGDNIADTSDIVFDSPGSNHTWAEYSNDGNFATGKNPRLVMDLNDGASPFSTITFALLPNTGSGYTAGTATARPSHTDEIVLANTIWYAGTTDVNRTFFGWRSDIGEIYFFITEQGSGIPEAFFALSRTDSAQSSLEWPVVMYGDTSGAGTGGALSDNLWETATNWEAFWQDSTPLSGSVIPRSITGDNSTNNWTNGRSGVDSEIPDVPIDIVWNGFGENAYAGRIVDWRRGADEQLSDLDQTGDSDAVVRRTLGVLWAPVRDGVSFSL